MYLIYCGTIVILAFIYFYVQNAYNYWKNRKVKFLPPTFLIGNLNFYPQKPMTDLLELCYNAFPNNRYMGLFQFIQPTLLIRDPDLIKEVTVKHFDHFVDHRNIIDIESEPIWSKNLLARNGDSWRQMRGILSPSFTLSKMKTIFDLMNDVAINFIRFYEAKDGIVEIDAKDVMSRVANDVIASAAFGFNVDSNKEPDNKFYQTGKDLTNFTGWKFLRLFIPILSKTLAKILKVRIISEDVGNYFTEIIHKAINAREKQGIVRPDMIQLLLEAKKKQAVDDGKEKLQLTNDDIVSQAMIFFFAGFDTISTALAFALYEITINEDVQERLHQEVLDQPKKLTYESIQGMKYLEMVISESLRKWPASIFTDRVVTKPFTIEPVYPDESPIHLETNVVCWLPIWAIQRDPNYFPDPEKFDPERFSDANKDKIVSGTYFPFGNGPRMCIGNRFALLEMKTVICNLVRSYELVKTKRTPYPLVLDPGQALASLGGISIGLKRRTKS